MAARQRISDEFTLIARHFAPLAAEPGAFGLTDDAAVLSLPPGHQFVVTSDCLLADVHYRSEDDPADIAAKVLRANLSDLAAMGATPHAYTLAAAFPDTIDEDWIAAFAAGLAADQERFAIGLIGGDTVMTPGPLSLTVTALGVVPDGQAILRSTAKSGDIIYVSGTIGDAALGLKYLLGHLDTVDASSGAAFVDRYLRPRPRTELGPKLVALATAAVDVSDGLVADLGHICRASGVDSTVRATAVPLSESAQAAIAGNPDLANEILIGGDDYELIFSAPPGASAALARLARELDVPLTAIGDLRTGSGIVEVIDAAGETMVLESVGYRHF